MKFLVLLGILGLLTGQLHGQSLKAVARNLEKQEFDKAEEALNKSLEKNPVNAGAKYFKSLLLVETGYNSYNIDSAYYYILESLADYASADQKEIQKLIKDDIQESTLTRQKARIEGLGYDRALEDNSVGGYDLYIQNFPTATEVNEATRKRDQLAFAQAENEGTYAGYQRFINTYPEAEQVPEATQRFESLWFEEETGDRKLESYVRFLDKNPETPFRAQAVENIYRIQTAGHAIDQYLAFLEKYPRSHLRDQAVNMLYHLYKEQGSLEEFVNTGFSNDSIDQAIVMEQEDLISVYQNGKYGFVNTFGDVVFSPTLEYLPESYRCSIVTNDYLLLTFRDTLSIYARNGSVAYQEGLESANDLGAGLLKIERDGRTGVIHKSGHTILEPAYSDVQLVQGRFLKVKRDERWGLRSVTDLKLLDIQYDQIEALGDFIILEKNGRIAVTTGQDLVNAANQAPLNLTFDFDEVELIREKYLLGYVGDREVLLGTDLDSKFELDEQQILDLDRHWIVKRNDGYHIYNANFEPLTNKPYHDVFYNSSWLVLENDGKWALQSQVENFNPQFDYTLAKLLSEQISLVFSEKNSYAIFDRADTLETTGLTVQIIRPLDPEIPDHLLTIDNEGVKRLYGPTGVKILGGRFDQVSVLSTHLFVVDENGRKGLSDSTGRNVLPINNDAIGDYFNGSVSILRGGKFGLFHYPSRTTIDPKYQSQLVPFRKDIFVAEEDDLKGLIDLKDRTVLGFEFDEIEYWNDTTALVKQGELWQLRSIYSTSTDTSWFELLTYVDDENDHKTIIYRGPEGVGVKSNTAGQIIEAGYDQIHLVEGSEPVYIGAKSIPQADYYVLVYFGMEGRHFWRQSLTKSEFDNVNCQ